MSLDEKRLTLKFFFTVMGSVCAFYATLWGWNWIRVDKVEARQQAMDNATSQINTQLSQIQTDLKWIINTEQNKK
jgi:hypothetical protein